MLDELDDESDLKQNESVSLNTIINKLRDDGNDAFSESIIYRVRISKRTIAMARSLTGFRLVSHVMVEATLNVHKDEPAITVYLRDVSQYVEMHKLYHETLKEKMKAEVENSIVENLANQLSKQHALNQVKDPESSVEVGEANSQQVN